MLIEQYLSKVIETIDSSGSLTIVTLENDTSFPFVLDNILIRFNSNTSVSFGLQLLHDGVFSTVFAFSLAAAANNRTELGLVIPSGEDLKINISGGTGAVAGRIMLNYRSFFLWQTHHVG